MSHSDHCCNCLAEQQMKPKKKNKKPAETATMSVARPQSPAWNWPTTVVVVVVLVLVGVLTALGFTVASVLVAIGGAALIAVDLVHRIPTPRSAS